MDTNLSKSSRKPFWPSFKRIAYRVSVYILIFLTCMTGGLWMGKVIHRHHFAIEPVPKAVIQNATKNPSKWSKEKDQYFTVFYNEDKSIAYRLHNSMTTGDLFVIKNGEWEAYKINHTNSEKSLLKFFVRVVETSESEDRLEYEQQIVERLSQ